MPRPGGGSPRPVADMLNPEEKPPDPIVNPPAGCRVSDDGHEIRIYASARSVPSFCKSFFMAAVFNGVTFMFMLDAIAATVRFAGGSVPAWFPSSTPAGLPGTLRDILLLWLFLTPFVAVGAVLALVFATVAFGGCEVQLRNGKGAIFTGVWPFGWRRRFDVSRVTSVQIDDSAKFVAVAGEGESRCVVIHAGRRYRFGVILPAARREWMRAVLSRLLVGSAPSAPGAARHPS